MKKLILILLFSITLLSCSKDDKCNEEKAKITAFYEQQIQLCYNANSPFGIDYRKIQLLTQERDRKLSQACN